MQVKALTARSGPGSCGIAARAEGEVGQDRMGQAGWDGAASTGKQDPEPCAHPGRDSRVPQFPHQGGHINFSATTVT